LTSGGAPSRLVIITTEAIAAGSSKIYDFYWHKWANRGLDPILITETHYGGLTGQAPNGTAEKIRKWLQDNYITMGINYVLLIGDPNPATGDVPMKMMYPRKGLSYEVSPTDYFYADLTGNWDYDGDGYFGEFYHDWSDPPSGGVDLTPELYVGRIPVYAADYATLDSILQKIMDYEMEVNPTWRNTALLPMSFSEAGYDGAMLAEQMMDDYLDAEGYSSWTMYPQGSGACAVNSSYPSSQELRGGTVVRDRWAANDYGSVLWWGHGDPTTAIVGYSGCDDGTLMSSTYANSLDDDHPAFVYLNSCTNGYPESSSNLGYALLKNGAIGTVSASRVSWYNSTVLYGMFDGSTTNSGIGYEFDRRLNDYKYPAGLALYNAKASMTPISDTRLMNYYDFNLYGDPTTSIADHAPPKVVINEVNVSEFNDEVELYNYGSTSVNLTGWNFRAYRTYLESTEMTAYTLPSFWLPAGGYVVLHETSGVNTATDLYINDNIFWFAGNSGSAVLYDDEWVGVDFMKWDDDTSHAPSGTGWVGPNPPYPPADGDPQLSRIPNGVDTNYGSDWSLRALTMGRPNSSTIADFNGDGDTDVSVFRPSTGKWYVKDQYLVKYGISGDIPVPGDYDGDGDWDVAVFRPSTGKWYIKDQYQVNYGMSGDIPVPGDYDGDGDWDVAVFRPSTGKWYVKDQFQVNYGMSGDIPVPGDYDGDGDWDVAVFRPSTGKWYVKDQFQVKYGMSGDIPVPGDYDGDGDWDVALFRPSVGKWYIKDQYQVNYGMSGDIPVTGDYDGDGDWDVALFRPSTGKWYVKDQFQVNYGMSGDFPLPVRDTNGDGDPYQ